MGAGLVGAPTPPPRRRRAPRVRARPIQAIAFPDPAFAQRPPPRQQEPPAPAPGGGASRGPPASAPKTIAAVASIASIASIAAVTAIPEPDDASSSSSSESDSTDDDDDEEEEDQQEQEEQQPEEQEELAVAYEVLEHTKRRRNAEECVSQAAVRREPLCGGSMRSASVCIDVNVFV